MGRLKALAVIITTLLLSACNSGPEPQQLAYQKQVKIESQTKFEIQPRIWTPGETLVIHVTRRGTQNPDLVFADLSDYAILEDHEDTPLEPIKWVITEEEEYHSTGELHFDFPNQPSNLSLILFIPEELRFDWVKKENTK